MHFTRFNPLVRRLATALALSLLCATAPVADAAQPTEWKEFQSKEGRFAILMPGSPSLEKQMISSDVGPLDMYSYTVKADDMLCRVIYYDVPPARGEANEALLDETCNEFVKGANLQEKIGRRALALGGNPGREIVGKTPDDAFVLVVRYYLVHRRIYMVTLIAEASSPDVGRYLDSFRLVRG